MWDILSSHVLTSHYREPPYFTFTFKPERRHPFAETIRKAHAPFIHPITAPYFVTYEGSNFTLKGDPVWTKPLGKDLCVVDIDGRPFSNKHEVFNEHRLNWGSFDKFSVGVLNHYLYGKESFFKTPWNLLNH